MLAKFLRIIGWALGDETWRFPIYGDVRSVLHQLGEKVQKTGKILVQLPMYTQKGEKYAGYIDHKTIILRSPNKWYGVGSVVSLDRIFIFKGTILDAHSELTGRFQLLLPIRIFLCTIYIFILVGILVSFIASVWNLVYLTDLVIFGRGIVISTVILLIFTLILLFVRIVVRLTSRAKNEMKKFLQQSLGV